ncbi:MAG TPA: endonuclease/exonuclease/phosphatase family protein [Anaerolineae bacterium]|nr:endonuclease/exonuclease/phosphatase family protein [Anaerolineae bacterium]
MKPDISGKYSIQQIGRTTCMVAWLAAGVYGCITTLWAGLKLIAPSWSPVEMLSSFSPLLLLPSLLILPLSLWRRRWSVMLLSVPAVAAFLLGYGESFLPRSITINPVAQPLRFLTYNLHAESVSIQPMLDVIRAAGADVVALQEVSPAMAEVLTAQLADEYPYQALHPNFDNPIFGQGVLSRYPIVEDEYWRISLGHQRVKIDRNGSPLVLYNTHPVHPFLLGQGRLFDMRPHQLEVQEVLRRSTLDGGEILIAGDFNMSDQASDYARLTAQFGDTYREIGWGLGWTFPDFTQPNAQPVRTSILSAFGRPVARIDFIFHNDALRPVSARVWPTSGGSDHRPVIAEFMDAPTQSASARP